MSDLPPGTYIATAREREWLLADYIVAGRPPRDLTAGNTMQHLFAKRGWWSLCGETQWLAVIRWSLLGRHVPQAVEPGRPVPDAPPFVPDRAWICTRCQAAAVADSVRRDVCPECRASLTDPRRSPGGRRHCRACRCGWLVEVRDGAETPVRQDWPAMAVAVLMPVRANAVITETNGRLFDLGVFLREGMPIAKADDEPRYSAIPQHDGSCWYVRDRRFGRTVAEWPSQEEAEADVEKRNAADRRAVTVDVATVEIGQ